MKEGERESETLAEATLSTSPTNPGAKGLDQIDLIDIRPHYTARVFLPILPCGDRVVSGFRTRVEWRVWALETRATLTTSSSVPLAESFNCAVNES